MTTECLDEIEDPDLFTPEELQALKVVPSRAWAKLSILVIMATIVVLSIALAATGHLSNPDSGARQVPTYLFDNPR